MNEIYQFLTGPMLWLTFWVFLFGILFKIMRLGILAYNKERFLFTFFSFKYGFRSILNWLIPFRPVNMKNHAILASVTYIFHICLILAPLFLLAHISLLDEAWDIGWFTLSDTLIDLMTWIVLASCIFFFVRRITQKEVKYLTTTSDYVLLIIVAMPFFTGLVAYHQWVAYRFFLNLHILSGEIMLMAIPFTRLSHMVLSPLTRAYIGSEFGGVRHTKDW